MVCTQDHQQVRGSGTVANKNGTGSSPPSMPFVARCAMDAVNAAFYVIRSTIEFIGDTQSPKTPSQIVLSVGYR